MEFDASTPTPTRLITGTPERKTFDCSHLWTIDNFSSHCSEKRMLNSNTFSKNGIEWFCNLKFDNDQEQMVVRCHLLHTDKPKISARCGFSILNYKDEKAYTFGEFDTVTGVYPKFFNFSTCALFRNGNELLPNDKLRIYCEVSACDLSNQQAVNNITIPGCGPPDVYKLLFNDTKLSNVILSCEGKEFKAHRFILAAQSSVFQALLEPKVEERKCYRVDIIDINPAVLQEVLRFIYADKIMDFKKMAEDLLVAADKYDLHRLKAVCEKELSSTLSIKNVLKLLVFADLHNATQLKAKAIAFFKMHSTEVTETIEWKDFQYPHLVVK